MKKFRLQYIAPIISLLSALFIFHLAFENDSSITEQQKSALIVGGIFLLVVFILGLVKAIKSEFPKKL